MTFSKLNNSCQENYEKEINILDFIIVILKHKQMILSAIIITFIIINLFFYVTWQSNQSIYPDEIAECKISSTLNPDAFKSLIRSYPVIAGVLNTKDAITLLYPHLWNTKENKWKNDNEPSQEDAYNKLYQAIGIKWDSNVAIVSITGAVGVNIKTLLSIYIKELENYSIMTQILKLDLYEEAINQLLMKVEKNSKNLISKEEIQKNISEYLTALSFDKLRIKSIQFISVIDKPQLVNTAKAASTFITRSYFTIVLTSLFIVLIISIMLAFFLEYLYYLWEKYPEKIKDIKKLLK